MSRLASEWHIASASATGTSHAATGAPCQDFAACEIIATPDDTVFVALVCDGAGSAACAEVGAQLVAENFLDLIRAHFHADRPIDAITRAMTSEWMGRTVTLLEEKARTDDHELRDYACTLLGAAVGERSAVFFQVGDGAIVVSNGAEDGWSYLFWPQHGEFANTTNFVVSTDALEAMEFDFAPRRIAEVALFSDGIENLVLQRDPRSVHEPFFNQMFVPVRSSATTGIDEALSDGLARYLNSSTINERTNDDKTLILATRMIRPPEA